MVNPAPPRSGSPSWYTISPALRLCKARFRSAKWSRTICFSAPVPVPCRIVTVPAFTMMASSKYAINVSNASSARIPRRSSVRSKLNLCWRIVFTTDGCDEGMDLDSGFKSRKSFSTRFFVVCSFFAGSTCCLSFSTYARAACVLVLSAFDSFISRIVRSIVALVLESISAASSFASCSTAFFFAFSPAISLS